MPCAPVLALLGQQKGILSMMTYCRQLLWVNLAVLLALSFIAPHAAAQGDSAGASQYKIGIVDMQILLKDNKTRKEQYDLLQKEVDTLQKDITAMSDSIEKDKAQYDALPVETPDEERRALKTKIENDYDDYQNEMEKRQRTINTKEETILKETLERINSAINQVAVQDNYHLILSAKGGPNAVVLYHSPTIEITSKVQSILNSN
jgi:outer membrane protein